MDVTNKYPFPISVQLIGDVHGAGDVVIIEPGQSETVFGARINNSTVRSGFRCYSYAMAQIILDPKGDEKTFQLKKGEKIFLTAQEHNMKIVCADARVLSKT